ncbi:ADP-ribosylglycohydrolase [Friedmanniella endophytica]|uniref:ADP-ribosylglycohydrolase n=1 Tax=Microlunatus kandeliicorticis TaxID=1759536 RepID=A0A7W3ISC7_9ACTN|nr:ADP-ribosylglycohydrolase family protein [Microlunatus kandeliicorticis]MBA8794275.1 ADP-ribosylglycohydrolase [Microlunatus kandeliicorticis]
MAVGEDSWSIDLHGEAYTDKVLGCWLGKNAGGTLGTPVEEVWGRDEPFDLDWYPELRSGGLPNDDLEMQLVWLTALSQVGPELRAADLARYWLDHIGYNFDEYGLNKANLRLGLQPPVSGSWNNWFVDCMGCPIRSEVWACVAPGVPRVAARYAYEDAICDHAGGESVWGELFNVAIQSAAFVVDDADTLLDIGLSYVPEGTATARAVLAARRAHAEGLDWLAARRRVLEETPSRVAQYSPINLGFQTIGLLYGRDFGEALCLTVNCGWDTDSSGGSLGSWWGIRAGRSGLPEKWIEPFGTGLSTNESWGGVRHLTDGSAPIPTDVVELTAAIREQAARVLAHHGVPVENGVITVERESLYADDGVRALWARSPWTVAHDLGQLRVDVDYQGSAAARPGGVRELALTVHNPHPDPVVVGVSTLVPDGWRPAVPQTVEVAAAGAASVRLEIGVGGRAAVEQSNVVLVRAQPQGYPTVAPVPVTLAGAQAWRWRTVGGEEWTDLAVDGNALPLAELLSSATGPVELRGWIEATEPTKVRLGVDTTVDTVVRVNGTVLLDYAGPRLIRPSYGVEELVNRVVELRPGFNEVSVTLTVPSGATELAGHTFLSTPDRLRHGIVHLRRTRTPED